MKEANPIKDKYIMLIDVKDCPWVDKEMMKSLIPIFGNYFPDLLYK